MSSSESELITAFREEMQAGFAGFKSELRDGLAQVSNRLDRTNELLVETRVELHEMKGELHEMKGELHEMKTEMSLNMNGISNFLLQSERSHNKTDMRLDDLEDRVKNLENKKKQQP